MQVMLKNIMPNPFRDMDHYPINPQKIEALKKSIEDTDFWDNIVCRKAGNKVEIAYGHHRLHALREMFSPNHKVTLIPKDLDDEQMLKIMAHENLEEWGHVSDIERETVRAVVKAFAEDRIGLRKPADKARKDQHRHAPSFCTGISEDSLSSHPYNAETIANFLQWGTKTVDYTLRALCLIEQGHLTESQLKGLSHGQSRTVVDETNRAVRAAGELAKKAEREAMSAATPTLEKKVRSEAKKKAKAIVASTAKAVSSTLQKGGSKDDAKSAGVDARVSVQPKKELPEINQAASRLSSQIMRLLDPEYDPGKKLTEIIKHKQHLSDVSIQNLDRALEIVAEYVEGYRARLNK